MLASDWQVSSSKLKEIPSIPPKQQRRKMSSLTVLKPQSPERGKGADWPLGEGEREGPAGDEKTKAETQGERNEGTWEVGDSGRESGGKWENTTGGRRALSPTGPGVPFLRAPWTGLRAAAAQTSLEGSGRKRASAPSCSWCPQPPFLRPKRQALTRENQDRVTRTICLCPGRPPEQ